MSSEETATLEPETAPEIDLEEYQTALKTARKWREFDAELDQMSANVSQCASAVVEAKAELKAAKANHELAVDRLQRAIAERHQAKMPFAKASDEAPAADIPPEDDGKWKDRPVRELELPPGILTKLEDEKITTIGRLEFIRGCNDPDLPRGLLSIKGFGEAKITLIEDAVVNWLSRNRDNLHALAAEQADPEPIAEAPPEGDVSDEQTEEEVEGEPDGDDAETVSMADHQEVKDPAPRSAAKRSAK